MDFPDQSQCTDNGITSLLDLTPMCLLRRQVSENLYSLYTESSGFFILYDFSGHKPDLEGKIQICFRYGFDRPVLSVLGFMIYEFRNHINRWRYYAIHVVEQRGTVIDMFVTF